MQQDRKKKPYANSNTESSMSLGIIRQYDNEKFENPKIIR
jgi:hypothetical protein